jgi:hypothetical protein
MGAMDHKVIASLLLSLLGFVVTSGILLAYAILHWRQRKANVAFLKTNENGNHRSFHTLRHSILRRPTCWLAIKNRNLLTVQSALALHNPKPCSWVEGLSGEGEQKLFLSPPVNGWILVIGSALPDPSDDVDGCFRFLLELSRKVGHIQFFIADTMLNHHAWAQMESGRVIRGYAWAGKTLWNQGSITQPELDLSMRCYEYFEPPPTPNYTSSNPADTPVNNSEKVHFLASRWSVDPDEIDERFIDQEWGIVGEPSKRF